MATTVRKMAVTIKKWPELATVPTRFGSLRTWLIFERERISLTLAAIGHARPKFKKTLKMIAEFDFQKFEHLKGLEKYCNFKEFFW